MELRDLFDLDRLPTGKTGVRGIEPENGLYNTVMHICIFNSEGQMLIQQRQTRKKGFPDKWDVTCGGCQLSGETIRQTAQRELFEELGIDIDFSDKRPALTVNYAQGFDDFYILNRDVELSELRLQPEEVQAVKWASMNEIFDMIDSGEFIPFFKSFINLLFDIRNKPDCLNI